MQTSSPPEMTILDRLRFCINAYDLAELIDVEYSYLTYILYGMRDSVRYHEFPVKKKDGTYRKILSPHPKLKRVQSSLSNMLYACREAAFAHEISVKASSHGFEKNRSPFTNAAKHVGRRYVFNLDLKDFFPSIHIGRIIGVLTKDRAYQVNGNVAQMIAQLSCHKGLLPQGAPTSPILANMVASVMDRRLRKLAKEHRCSYSRYADDLTFSTNQRVFPKAIADFELNQQVKVGDVLAKIITRSGFQVHDGKVRMCLSQSKQSVTGLTVNVGVSTDRRYRKETRAMCHSLFKTGKYHISRDGDTEKLDVNNLKPLDGRLSYISKVSEQDRERKSKNAQLFFEEQKRLSNPTSYERLFARFLLFKSFANPEHPVVVGEGITDFMYLRSASRFVELFPKSLISNDRVNLSFYNPTERNQKYLKVGNGAGEFADFMVRLTREFDAFEHNFTRKPIIFIADCDQALKNCQKRLRSKQIRDYLPEKVVTNHCYRYGRYAYLITLNHHTQNAIIEDYFSSRLRSVMRGGKSFELSDEPTSETYSKKTFARYVVPNYILRDDVTSFSSIWASIEAAVFDFNQLS